MLVWTVFDNVPQVDRRLLGSERVVGCPNGGAASVETMVSSNSLLSKFLLLLSELRDKELMR